MLIKFFDRGTGSGAGAVDYLTRKDSPVTKKLRQPAPEVLRLGDSKLTADIIDGLGFKHKYRSGVLSFAPSDEPTEEEQQKLIDDFEAIAFAGIQEENRNILWVRHQHTGSNRVELHFLTPRVELSTGKSLNIAPPGWRSYFQPWQNKWNFKKGWARPDDPKRARVSSPTHTAFEAKRKAARGEQPTQDTRTRATAAVEKAIATGQAKDRPGVVKALQDNGFEILRATNKSITIVNQEWQGNPKASQAKVRLKSQTFYADWTLENQLNPLQFDAAEEILKLEAELQQKFAKRKSFNQDKYLQPESQKHPDPRDYASLSDFIKTTLGDRAIIPKNSNSISKAAERRRELQQLKRDINLIEFAEQQGYSKNARSSTANSVKLEHPNGDRIVVKPDPEGIDTYFSSQNSNDNGTVIDFIHRRENLALRQIRQLLREFLGEEDKKKRRAKNHEPQHKQSLIPPAIHQQMKDKQDRLKAEEDRRQQQQWQQNLHPITSHPYLQGDRGISEATLVESRFSGQVFKDDRNNVVFPYREGDRITGFELRNKDFKGFQKGGKKSLWMSNQRQEDSRLVIVESPIDALSYHQLNPHRDNRYLATGGTISNYQKELISQQLNLIDFQFAQVIIATDNDKDGDKLAAEIERLFKGKVIRVKSKLKDWNEDIVTKLQQKSLTSKPKNKSRLDKTFER